MVDHLTSARRSWNMSRIRSANTEPEKQVRSILHRLGFRYSLKRKDLPGKPDITLKKFKTTVFVHGCFWHRHKNCRDASTPKSNTAFWVTKFNYNASRDKKNRRKLTRLGWKVIVIWECEASNYSKVLQKVGKVLSL